MIAELDPGRSFRTCLPKSAQTLLSFQHKREQSVALDGSDVLKVTDFGADLPVDPFQFVLHAD
jgi:hypothetical protein